MPRLLAIAGLLAMLAAVPAAAVEPDEILDDPKLEERARDISAELRCLVCRNEAIDESNAELARDLRLLVRERLVAGDTNAEVKDFVVDRYGEYVLLKPPFSAANAAIWLAGPVLFLAGLGAALAFIRRRRPEAAASEAPLTAEEQAKLDRLLKDGSS
jgi:cytochrome c-type biogenesis protein CcmH